MNITCMNELNEELSKCTMSSFYSPVQLLPLKETSNSSLSYVDFEIACHQEGPDKVEIDSLQFREGLVDVE